MLALLGVTLLTTHGDLTDVCRVAGGADRGRCVRGVRDSV